MFLTTLNGLIFICILKLPPNCKNYWAYTNFISILNIFLSKINIFQLQGKWKTKKIISFKNWNILLNVLKLIAQEIPTFLMVFYSLAGEIIRPTNIVQSKVALKKQSFVKTKNASAKLITRFVITLSESTNSMQKLTAKSLEVQLQSSTKLILKCKRLPIEFQKCSRSLNICSKVLALTKAMRQSDKKSPITFKIQTKK